MRSFFSVQRALQLIASFSEVRLGRKHSNIEQQSNGCEQNQEDQLDIGTIVCPDRAVFLPTAGCKIDPLIVH